MSSEIKVDTISENTAANGVSIDGLTIKDGGITATTGAIVFNEASADVDFRIEGNGDANAFFLDGEVDRIYLGHNADTNINGLNARLQISGTDFDKSSASLIRYSADANPPSIGFAKSRNASIAGNTIVQDGDFLGRIRFAGADGGDFGNVAAQIDCQVDGTPGVNDMPGRLSFSTAADGGTGATERVRITSAGRLHFAHTSFSATTPNMTVFPEGQLYLAMNSSSSTNVVRFYNSATGNIGGNINMNGDATSYNSGSDYRLKDNVNYSFDATTRLKQLKPARFNFINTPDTTVDGFLAHEAQTVVPESVTGVHNETETRNKVVVNSNGIIIADDIKEADWTAGKIADDDGNTIYPTDSTWEASKVVPVYQSIDHSKMIPLLVKTIQELEARITALEG
tara:strand:- start:49 stop:1242 length:1194 start_codon:yes stop_codon:yes gene_type:complete